MITYIIKSVVCSGIFLLLYKIFLEKEKLHVFKRTYLLFAVVLALTIPLISIPVSTKNNTIVQVISTANEAMGNIERSYINQPSGNAKQTDKPSSISPSSRNFFSFQLWIILLYACIVTALLFRSIRNIYYLLHKIKHSTVVHNKNVKLVLVDKPMLPFSFMQYIFLCREQYQKQQINPAILAHEFAHVRQKHSLDIIFIEAVTAFFFFNPFLYGFKRTMQLNHEFLADEEGKEKAGNEEDYLYMLISAPALINKLNVFSHSFHYLITKKRIKMITQKTSTAKAFFKKSMVSVGVLIAVLLFSFTDADKVILQNVGEMVKAETSGTLKKALPYDTTPKPFINLKERSLGFTEEGVSEEELNRFRRILSQYNSDTGEVRGFYKGKMSNEDKKQLEEIYKQMSLQQQSSLSIAIVKPTKPSSQRMKLSEKQFEGFKNAAVYGIWIDGKKMPNTALDKYTAGDFSRYWVSKLYGAAKKGRSYTHQADLSTNSYFTKQYNEALKNYNEAVKNGEGEFMMLLFVADNKPHSIKAVTVKP
ncbi:MAG: hypothetical protein KF746_19910 [Chitinophagaceae bacterium]|nr:hypothetical protein [Chitinophagaceae bacterium]